MPRTAEIVICGAGIAGVSAAYFLSLKGFRDILLFDESEPLGLTSSRSTECYRNWWPDAEMLALMNRSIDLLEQLAEENNNTFRLNRRGYLYLTSQPEKITAMQAKAEKIAAMGAGHLRVHDGSLINYQANEKEGYKNIPAGADLILGNNLIRDLFPYLSPETVAGLHVRRAGWLDAWGLGKYLLEQAKQRGVRVEKAKLAAIETAGSKIKGIKLENGETIQTNIFINAAGPYIKSIASLVGVDLPVFTELHQKVAFRDHLGILGRDAPLIIWDDPQVLQWTDEERDDLAADPNTRWMTEEMPAGAHARPEGGENSPMALLLWEYAEKKMSPIFPPPLDESYPELALRGIAKMVPGLQQYFGKLPKPILDGGYYTKTQENRLLAGPAGPEGSYCIGALSGYGIMAACGAGDLLAAHISGENLPSYAPAFVLARYQDPAYQTLLRSWGDSGQL